MGCDHRQNIGGGFEIRQAQNWNPDGHPGTRLYCHGREVWPQVFWGQANANHDTFIFLSTNPSAEDSLPLAGSDTETNLVEKPSPYGNQLFAVKAGGIPVLISPLVFMKSSLNMSYEVISCNPTASGFNAVFRFWRDADHDSFITNSFTWPDLSGWIAQAGTNGELRKLVGTRFPYRTPMMGARGGKSR
jgi:hypothetical protein